MYKSLLVIFMLITLNVSSQTGEMVFVTNGTANVEWNPIKESKEAANKRAFDMAKRNLLEKAFPISISTVTEMKVSNKETDVGFKTSTESIIKGEIIDILSHKYDEKETKEAVAGSRTKKKVKWIICTVEAKVRRLDNPIIPVLTFASSSNEVLKVTEDFKIGDSFYLYFKSPVHGFLNVYVKTPNIVARILPYSGMSEKFENGVPIKSDKEYVFFSTDSKHQYFDIEKHVIDKLKFLKSGKSIEKNNIFVIFTKNPLTKPVLQKDIGNISNEDKQKGYKLPPSLTKREFKEWRISSLSSRADMQIHNIYLTIEDF